LEFLDEFDFFKNFCKKSTEYFFFFLTDYEGLRWGAYATKLADDPISHSSVNRYDPLT